MKLFGRVILFGFLLSLCFPFISHAGIDLSVSPIKYEIEASTGSVIIKSAKLINKTNNTYTIFTGKSDFTTSDTTGNPKFVRKSELVYPDQQLSNWITISTGSFIIGPNDTKSIQFAINIPENATPGGHYGAVFFKHQNNNEVNAGQVGVNVDYGVLLLVNVDGEIITKGEIDDFIIKEGGGPGSGESTKKIDDCPLGDFSYSNYDGKCIDNPFSEPKTDDIETIYKEKDTKEENNKPKKDKEDDIDISFEIPFKNSGNTHLKPKGKITLIDENGDTLKQVGKEIIKNDNGVIVGDKVVDYLPVNDVDGNVLPYSKRIFFSEWKGFPYKTYDDEGNHILKYWSPSEYYTKKNMDNDRFIMFWERVLEKTNNKKITALMEISYMDKNGEEIELNSAKEFDIKYTEKYVGLNYFVVISGILILHLLFVWFIVAWKRKKNCIHCDRKIRKDMKVCPYCGKKQKKKN